MTDRLDLLESFSDRCALFRYTVPVEMIEALQYEGSKYSPEFDLCGVSWRLHMQHRVDPQSNEVNLAIHLQCLSPSGAYGHFRLTLCNRDPAASKSKTFHCHFKKSGSAWGLHHFVPLERLLNVEHGYMEELSDGRRIGRRVVIDLVLNVLEAGADGTYALGHLPQSSRTFGGGSHSNNTNGGVGGGVVAVAPNSHHSMPQQTPRGLGSAGGYPSHSPQAFSDPYGGRGGGGSAAAATPAGGSYYQQQHNSMARDQHLHQQQDAAPLSTGHVKAPLVYPFEHLEALCDMIFDVAGVRIKAHRCVVAARMTPLLPAEMLPLQEGCAVPIHDTLEVFTAFLRYVYTEDYPEQGVLRPENLLDLYLLAARCEFFDLCGVCLKFVRPLLNAENILPIVLTKYSVGDEVLNALYLRILLDNYDLLIQNKLFEDIPGHLFRRLSLILREKERLPAVSIPPTRNTLGRQLAALAESGDYADYEIRIAHDAYLPAHRYILASRSVVFSQTFSPRAAAGAAATREPTFDGSDVSFSDRSWQKFLGALYRRTLGETARDLAAEDIALIFKMHHALTLDGQLKREAEHAVSSHNALRVLIYSVKHGVTELRDRAMAYVSTNFHMLVRSDAQAWDLIGELPQAAVVALFRTVTEAH